MTYEFTNINLNNILHNQQPFNYMNTTSSNRKPGNVYGHTVYTSDDDYAAAT